MALSQVTNFDTAANFVFDSTKVEISGSVARLKDRRAAGTILFASFNQKVDADYGAGVLTGTNHGATIASRKLHLDGTSYLDLPGGLNTFGQTGTIRFKMKMGYAGAPSAEQDWFAMCVPLANTNLIDMYHDAGGNITFRFGSASGAYIGNSTPTQWLPVLNQTYEFELNVDLTAGVQRLFIDGVLFTSTSFTGTRSQTATTIRLGASIGAAQKSLIDISDLEIFDTVQHTANFASEVPRASHTQYATDSPSIISVSDVSMDALLSFAASLAETTNSAIGLQVSVGGVLKWFNGSAWAASDGSYAQSNMAAQIAANVATLDLSAGVRFKVNAVLYSNYGDTRSTITSVTVGYDFFAASPAVPATCICYLYASDLKVAPVSDAKLVVALREPVIHSGRLILPFLSKLAFDSNGYLEVELVETVTPNVTLDVWLEYTNPANGKINVVANLDPIQVPNQVSLDLSTVLAVTL